MKIVRTEYEVVSGRPVVSLFCREDGKRKVVQDDSLVPYFYVPYNERDRVPGIQYDSSQHYTSIYGERLAKIYTTLPSDVPKLRDKYSRHYEADIVFPIRWLIDKGDQLEACSPKVMFIDIETTNTGRVPDPNTAPEPIICMTAYSDNVYTTFIYRSNLSEGSETRMAYDTLHEIHYYRSEEELVQGFLDYYVNEEPDVLTGWNFTLFDLPYIINRMKRIGIDYTRMSPMGIVYSDEQYRNTTIKGVSIVDLLATYKHFTQPTQGMKGSYTLDAIGRDVVGAGKVGSSSNIRWMWKYKLDELIKYNLHDTYLCVAIDEKEKLLDFLNELRILCHCQLEDCLTTTRLLDSYVLRMFHNELVFPSKQHYITKKYQGAIVESTGSGLHENVTVYDLKSLYPSIVLLANLSPESMRDKLEEGTVQLGDHYVRQDIDGYLPKVISQLMKERVRYKKLMTQETYGSDQHKFYDMRQYAMKIVLNAIYGQTAYSGSRLFDQRVAETITWMGRQIITWSKEYLNSIGYKVIYVDTDSCHVAFGDSDVDHVKVVLELVNDSYNEFAKQMGLSGNQFLEMELDKIYRKVFYGKDTKKRYAGALQYKDGKSVDALDIWGFETKRSDASKFTKDMMTKVFDMVLRQDKSKDEVLRYIGNEIDRVRTGKFKFEEIGIPKGMTRDPRSYSRGVPNKNLASWQQKGVPANIRGTLYSIDVLGLEISSKPKLIYVSKMPDGYEHTDAICIDEEKQVPPGTQIDVEKMLEKIVKAKLESIFEGLGWKMSDLQLWWRGRAPKQGYQETLL